MQVYQVRDRGGSSYLLEAPNRDLAQAWMIATHGRSILPISMRALPAGDVMRLIRATGVRPTRCIKTPRVHHELERLLHAKGERE